MNRSKHIQEILEQYPNLSKHSDAWVIGLYQSICEEQVLQEFIERTINPDKTLETLDKRFFGKFKTADNDPGHGIWIKYDTKHFKNINDINKFLDSFGWFPENIAHFGPYNKDNLVKAFKESSTTTVYYGAKYDTEEKILTPLYHLVPDVLYKHVLLKGLTPKTKSKISSHPERIYLLNPTDQENYYDVALTLWNSIPPSTTKNAIQDYYLLKIDTSKLPKHKFYTDPKFYMADGAVWTYQNIPTSAIQAIKKFEVNPKPIISESLEIFNEWRNKFRNTI